MSRNFFATAFVILAVFVAIFSILFSLNERQMLEGRVSALEYNLQSEQDQRLLLENRMSGWLNGSTFVLNVWQPIDTDYQIAFVSSGGLMNRIGDVDQGWIVEPLEFVLIRVSDGKELARIRVEPKGGDLIKVFFLKTPRNNKVTHFVPLEVGGGLAMEVEHFFKQYQVVP